MNLRSDLSCSSPVVIWKQSSTTQHICIDSQGFSTSIGLHPFHFSATTWRV